jgi:hypothetical protein
MAFKFRLLQGNHQEHGVTYNARNNNIIVSPYDLAKRFNQHGCLKFEALGEVPNSELPNPNAVPQEMPGQDLQEYVDQNTTNEEKEQELVADVYDDMDIDELRAFAEDANIPLGNARTKAAIIKKLRAQA